MVYDVVKRGVFGALVLIFVTLLAFNVQAANGCFTEPSFVALNDGCADITDATARADSRYCGSAQNVQQCMDKHFLSVTCSQVPICQRNSGTWCGDTCEQVEFQAACTDRNVWVPPLADGSSPPTPSQCERGCCVCSAAFGSVCPGTDFYQKTRNACETACTGLGGIGFFNKDPSFDRAQCTPKCGNLQSTQGKVEGFVRNVAGAPIVGAIVSTHQDSSTTDPTGHYSIENLPEGHSTLRVSHSQYITKQIDVQLSSGETKQQNIVLNAALVGVIRGVARSNGVALSGVRVAVLQSSLQPQTTTNLGEFEFQRAPYGTYSVEATAMGFGAQRKTAVLSASSQVAQLTFDLVREDVGTITGRAKDKNTGNPISNARIYVDNPLVPARLSGPDGVFSIIKPASTAGIVYRIHAEHLDYMKSAVVSVTVTTGGVVPVDFELAPKEKECEYPAALPVPFFAAEHVGGEKMVKLRWDRPCAGVAGFIINRSFAIEGFSRAVSQQISFVGGISYEDEDVEWATSYEYDIVAVYTDGPQPRMSNKTTASITTGDEECEGKYDGNLFFEFCDGRSRKVCTTENKVQELALCSGTTFCAGTVNSITTCEDTGICSSEALVANPFGLWFTQTGCYGTYDVSLQRFSNFCAFDRTRTIFDACIPCNEITSCFAYKGKEACELNNCFAGDCRWVDAARELGTGYCVDADAQDKFGTSQCDQCSSTASLFTSALCTGEICSALGACYASADKKFCAQCEEGLSSCYAFTSQAECVGSGSSARFQDGVLVPSHDACSLERCRWNAQHDVCFKDGDGNVADDCAGASASCKFDNTAPKTRIEPDVIRIKSLSDTLRFHVDGIGKVFYCIDKTNTCMPATSSLTRSDGTLVLRLDAAGFGQVYDGSEHYFIRYFSEDGFFNRENIQSRRFGADLDAPVIDVQHMVNLNATGSAAAFTINLDKAASCTDSLVRIGSAPLSRITNNRTLSRVVSYTNIHDGLYTYRVDCTDNYGNIAHKTLTVEVYAEGFIRVIMPPRALKTSSFHFEVNTSAPALCELVEESISREAMTPSADSISHKSTRKSFNPNTYYSGWRAECTEANGKKHMRHILFSIDLQPPSTSLVVVSPEGAVTRYSNTGFHALANNESLIALECKDNPLDAGQEVGFGCADSFACLNKSGECDPRSTLFLFIDGDGTLCFYSTDNGGNAEAVKCGTIELSSHFGITITEPSFGVSNIPNYDLEIHTATSSTECKWAGATGASFDFESLVTASQVFTPVGPHMFRIDGFSALLPHLGDGELELIEIKCKSTTGKVSPPDRFEIGYDTTIPVIQIHRAEPSLVTQGNSVDFVVITNEPTICKYGQAPAYGQLPTGFPGFAENDFVREHRARKSLVAADDNKQHVYNVSCMNRAENMSLVVPITFEVNFSVAGAIAETRPAGAIGTTNLTLLVRTSKNAFCQYAQGSGFSALGSSNGLLHEQRVSGLAQGSHSYPVQCRFSQPVVNRDATISFIVDLTPPIVRSVEDGNYSCSLVRAKPSIDAMDNVSSVVGYEVKLLTDSGAVISQANVSSNTPELTTLNLTAGKHYLYKVKAVDAAGNKGSEVSSNGFTALVSNATECKENKAPTLQISSAITRNGATVTLTCTDDTSCAVTQYGTAEKSSDCVADTSYSIPVVLEEEAHFCAYAEDSAGNQARDSKFISIPDEDGDSVPDTFDECADTHAGDSVDTDGCAHSQMDTDDDGLDDEWELQYDAADCPLDPHERDSNTDGTEDGDEDYDKDTVLNVDEFRAKSNPCRRVVQQEPRQPSGDTSQDEEEPSHLFAVILLVFGIFFILGGVGYLVYLNYQNKEQVSAAPVSAMPRVSPRPIPPRVPITEKREARRREAQEKRRRVFSAFGSFGPQTDKSQSESDTTLDELKEIIKKREK